MYQHFLLDFELEKKLKNVAKRKNSKWRLNSRRRLNSRWRWKQDGGENVFFIKIMLSNHFFLVIQNGG
jgi:hypothetical protein